MVLLPTERVPLHIFEDRYQELIGECLELEREFGLVLADDDGIRDVGTRAAVVAVLERFDDGRMNVVVEGRERFRIVKLTAGRSFRTADVEPLDDLEPEPDDAGLAQAVTTLRRVAELAGSDAS
jgi:Lon protease-like protein